MKTSSNLGIYIHIPFCIRKCRYCDFSSFVVADTSVHDAYVTNLCKEIENRKNEVGTDYLVDSIYLGGGTPSILAPKHISKILNTISKNYNILENVEITIEANPGAISKSSLSSYYESGINRLSIGAQSFNNDILGFLGRIHKAEDTIAGYADAISAGFENISLDLIFGIPEQSLEMWASDLKSAITLGPKHISHYSLQIEEGTPIYNDWEQGKIKQLDEEVDREMYHTAEEILNGAGYQRYEISNSSKPNYESRHNLKYWNMDEYMGFGLGAHSYTNRCRYSNTSVLQEYLDADDTINMQNFFHENTLDEEMSEFIFLGLRRSEGISLDEFNRRFKKNFENLYGVKTKEMIGKGLLVVERGNLRLTTLGFDLANTVFCEYV